MSDPQYYNIWHKVKNRWTNSSTHFGGQFRDQSNLDPFPLTLNEAQKWFREASFSSNTFEVRPLASTDIRPHLLQIRRDYDKVIAHRLDQQRRKEHADKYL